MFWLLVLSTIFLGIGVIVFLLTRDSFRASRTRRETPIIASPVKKYSDASAINAMMQEKLPPQPATPNPATLFPGQNAEEMDALADTLDQVKENPILPTTPKAYLRLEEHDDDLERLLIRSIHRPGGTLQTPPREFSIGVTEEREALLEHEKEILRSEIEQKNNR